MFVQDHVYTNKALKSLFTTLTVQSLLKCLLCRPHGCLNGSEFSVNKVADIQRSYER